MSAPATTRGKVVKRVVLSAVAGVILLALYILGAPLIWFGTWKYVPELLPVVRVVYRPYYYYCSHPEYPGVTAINEYFNWCYNEARIRTR